MGQSGDNVPKLIEGSMLPTSNIYHFKLTQCICICHRFYIGLNCIFHKSKVAGSLSISVNSRSFLVNSSLYKQWDNGCIGAVWVLPGTKNIEVPQAYGMYSIYLRKHIGIKFIHEFGYGIRGEGIPFISFFLRQA